MIRTTKAFRARSITYLLATLTAATVASSFATEAGRMTHPKMAAFLICSAVVLGMTIVSLRAGRLTLLAIPLLASVVLLTPSEAAIAGVLGNVGRSLQSKQLRWSVLAPSAFWASVASAADEGLRAHSAPVWIAASIAMLLGLALNLAGSLLQVSSTRSESVREVWQATVDRGFITAYLYFLLAGVLSVSLLDGSPLGYVRAATLYLLSLALVQAVSGRVTVHALREQLQVIDERIVFGQEAEAALHAVKNQLALASHYLEDISAAGLGRSGREALRIVFNSMQQSSDILRRTSAAGRSANSPVFVDANLVELAHSVVVLAQARAAQAEVRVNLVTRARAVPIYADPFLIREILTNLVSNSLEAVAGRGRIDVVVGLRSDGSPFAQVVDDGPGLSEAAKRTILETRTSTNEASGAGIGLTLSLSIATQHGGRLTYDKRRRKGASFTLVLPPRDVARVKLAPHSKTASRPPQTGRSQPEVALLPGS